MFGALAFMGMHSLHTLTQGNKVTLGWHSVEVQWNAGPGAALVLSKPGHHVIYHVVV